MTDPVMRHSSHNASVPFGLSSEDIHHYDRHGWFLSDVLLTPAELEEATAASDRFYAGHRDGLPPVRTKPELDWRPEYGEQSLRMNDYITFQSTQLRRLAFHSSIARVAAGLARTSQIRLFHSALAWKSPVSGDIEGGRVGWHTDKAYWQTCSSSQLLTAFIPLHDCDESMGTLLMIDGSHLWPADDPRLERLRAAQSVRHDNIAQLRNHLESLGYPVTVTPMVYKAGQVSFHNCMVLHGSLENRGRRPRRSLIVHMQDAANEFRWVQGKDGAFVTLVTDTAARRLPDGRPDYSDPIVYPVIWDASAPVD